MKIRFWRGGDAKEEERGLSMREEGPPLVLSVVFHQQNNALEMKFRTVWLFQEFIKQKNIYSLFAQQIRQCMEA